MVRLIAVLEAPEDVHGVVHSGLADQHGLEPTLQRRVLLYVLAVLVNGCGAHDVQLAARQGGLEHVGGVHRALGGARPHYRVQLVYEQDLPLGLSLASSMTFLRRSSNCPLYRVPVTMLERSRARILLLFKVSGTSSLTIL